MEKEVAYVAVTGAHMIIRFLVPKWSIGLQNDMVVATFKIEDHEPL